MHVGIDYHMAQLRSQLRRNSKLLGGAIGIDVAPASWSIDHRGNPIVVGRGVVEACRLGDGTQAGRIRLGNMAYNELDEGMKRDKSLCEVAYSSKEVDAKMELVVWEIVQSPTSLGSG